MEFLAIAVALGVLAAWDFGRRSLDTRRNAASEGVETELRGEIAALGTRVTEMERETKQARSTASHALQSVGSITGSRKGRR